MAAYLQKYGVVLITTGSAALLTSIGAFATGRQKGLIRDEEHQCDARVFFAVIPPRTACDFESRPDKEGSHYIPLAQFDLNHNQLKASSHK